MKSATKALKSFRTSRKRKQQKKLFRQIWQGLRVGQEGVCDEFSGADPAIFGKKYRVEQGNKSIKEYPLSLICMKRPSLELVKLVHKAFPTAIANTESDVDKDDHHRILPLHYACRYGASLEVIRYLVEEYRKGIEQADRNGDLALHCACGTQLEWSAELEKKEIPDRTQPRDRRLVSWRGTRLEVLKYLISVYPESVKVQNSSGWLPLHALCGFRPSLDNTHYLLSRYPEGVNVKTRGGYIPAQLMVLAHRSKKGASSAPPDILGFLEFVETNLRDPYRSDALPMSRFALEWEILHRELVQEYAQSSRNRQCVRVGVVAKEQLDLFLCPLRKQYPSLEALRHMESNEDLRKAWIMEKDDIQLQISKENEDSEMIPRESSERIRASEAEMDALKKVVESPRRDVSLRQKLKMANDRAKIEVQLLAEKKIHDKCGLTNADDHEPVCAATVASAAVPQPVDSKPEKSPRGRKKDHHWRREADNTKNAGKGVKRGHSIIQWGIRVPRRLLA